MYAILGINHEFINIVFFEISWSWADFEPKIRLFVYFEGKEELWEEEEGEEEVSLIEVVVWTGLRWSFH